MVFFCFKKKKQWKTQTQDAKNSNLVYNFFHLTHCSKVVFPQTCSNLFSLSLKRHKKCNFWLPDMLGTLD